MSCANITTPTGGGRDETGPVIKASNVKDSMLQFKGGDVIFEFDEFVQIKDEQNQLVISPLLKKKPKLEAHKRRVTLKLSDTLLEPNTTYHISFGHAIQDIHEGNPIKNLSFSFSTGNHFDSLSLQGKVMIASTGMADTSCWVALYPVEHADSDFVNKRPRYLQKVSGGLFEIKNLPAEPFAIYALRDLNGNLKLDPTEWFAFYPTTVNPADSGGNIQLYLYQETKAQPDSNRPRLGLKTKAATPKGVNISYKINADTLNKTKRTFDISDTLKITFDRKITSIALSKIKLLQDSVIDATARISLDTVTNTIRILTEWMDDKLYTLSLQSGFAEDSSTALCSSGEYTFRTKKKSDYGFLTIKHGIQANHILFLYKDQTLIGKVALTDTISSFALLSPGEYRLERLHDENNNGQWDPGVFALKRQPEVVERLPQGIMIKSNWENKIDLRILPKGNPTKN